MSDFFQCGGRLSERFLKRNTESVIVSKEGSRILFYATGILPGAGSNILWYVIHIQILCRIFGPWKTKQSINSSSL
jgi:hypothetical protein